MEEDIDGAGGLEDRALMERVREGDSNAFGELLGRYWPQLTSYAAGIVGGRDRGKDVVQDAFIHVWKRRAHWRPTGSVSAYLYRITRNLALNARRDRRTQEQKDAEAGELPTSWASPRQPDEVLRSTTTREEVEQAIASLPERRREVFVLSRFHGLTHKQIAEATGVSPQTVSNQMTAALSELRDRLAHLVDETG